MNITETTDDNMSLCNCTNDDNDMILERSPLIFIISIIPCALSILCCLLFLSYGFIKTLIKKNKIWIHTIIIIYTNISVLILGRNTLI